MVGFGFRESGRDLALKDSVVVFNELLDRDRHARVHLRCQPISGDGRALSTETISGQSIYPPSCLSYPSICLHIYLSSRLSIYAVFFDFFSITL